MIDASQQIAGVSFNPFIHPSDSNYPYYRNNLFHIGHSMGTWFNEKIYLIPHTLLLMCGRISCITCGALNFSSTGHARPPLNHASKIWNKPCGRCTPADMQHLLTQMLFFCRNYFLNTVIYNDAHECAHSREILGVHFPSDSEAGRILARQLIDAMLKTEKFQKDLLEAKKEIAQLRKKIKVN